MKDAPRFLNSAKRFLLIACVLLWAVAFAATHTPVSRMPSRMPSDKLLHFVGYFVLAGLFLATLAGHGLLRVRRALIAICVMLIYGVIDEVTQPLVNRSAAFGDWVADAAGAIAAVLILEILFALVTGRGGKSTPNI